MEPQPKTLLSISIATASTIGKNQAPTGIVKCPIDEPVTIEAMGLVGDFQADRRVHGGLDKAVYHFPVENYQTISEALPHLAKKLSQPPCVGENFSSTGMMDDTVYIGDCYRIGTALLQVSQPRMPCWKLNHHVGNAHVAELLISLRQTGWYYRVLEAGTAQAGDTFTLTERLQEDYTVAGVWERWLALREQKRSHGEPITIKGLSTEWRFDWG